MNKPVDAEGLFEQGRVPAQVDDIIILAQVLPCNPEHTWVPTQNIYNQ